MASATSHVVSGFAANALASLTPSQLDFLRKLPKAELHAHLNGSIPLPVLQKLAHDFLEHESPSPTFDTVKAGIDRLRQGVILNEIHEFFELFPAIYALTSTPPSLALAARAVLHYFLASTDGYSEASYLEVRSTPRETSSMNRLKYLETVLEEVERYPENQAALIVSLDRRMNTVVAQECVEHAIKLKQEGRRVVGVDLCGDPKAGDMEEFAKHFRAAKEAGLGVTLHVAEIEQSPPTEILQLLSYGPDRLGHATFLNNVAKEIVRKNKTYYLQHDHPIAICTDDILPFRNSLIGEYAMLMAAPPLGLGLTESEVAKIAQMGMECRFRMGSHSPSNAGS